MDFNPRPYVSIHKNGGLFYSLLYDCQSCQLSSPFVPFSSQKIRNVFAAAPFHIETDRLCISETSEHSAALCANGPFQDFSRIDEEMQKLHDQEKV